MDPALWELEEAGAADDEVNVIIRLIDPHVHPREARIVSQFGNIATARVRRSEIRSLWASTHVASVKASRRLARPSMDDDIEDLPWEQDPHGWPLEADQGERPPIPEEGRGVVVGVCDWGFDFTHPNLRNPDGTTRIRALWDQSIEGGEGVPPYGYGRLYSKLEIDRALAVDDPIGALGYDPSATDARGSGAHGTHVLDILAGNRREVGSTAGMAGASDLVCVHLASSRMSRLANFGDSCTLLEGLDFIRRAAGASPLVLHLSAGKTGGPHDGTTPFEQAIDALLTERAGVALVQSVGNYANSRMHSHGRVLPHESRTLHWLISPRDRTENELEVRYSGDDVFGLTLIAPDGTRFSVPLGEHSPLVADGVRWGAMYHRRSEPNSGKNHIDIFLRTDSPPGRYRVELHGLEIFDGRFHGWIERDAGGRHQSRFARRQATSRYTTNTICNSLRAIAVGAYDATSDARPPTAFSSSGPTADGRQKPEIVAPGYRIRAARSVPEGGWGGESRLTVKSGTSMAAPWVSGTVALMFEAAGRPMSIDEVRRILISTAERPASRRSRASRRLGYGYLNAARAVAEARALASPAHREESHEADGFSPLQDGLDPLELDQGAGAWPVESPEEGVQRESLEEEASHVSATRSPAQTGAPVSLWGEQHLPPADASDTEASEREGLELSAIYEQLDRLSEH